MEIVIGTSVLISAYKIERFQKGVIEYFNAHGRKSLPWRLTRDPWKILLSELLLRKTTANQVIPVYSQLAELGLKKLSVIKKARLEKILLPIGLYKERTSIIKAAAKEVNRAGEVELSNIDFLQNLPGVGWYSFNTVRCFAFGDALPALDRNMIRILGRVFSITSEKTRPHTDKKLWKLAELFVPKGQAKEYNWGILDLAAALCRPQKPLCEDCPLQNICDYALRKE